jgi:hypothetical protein
LDQEEGKKITTGNCSLVKGELMGGKGLGKQDSVTNRVRSGKIAANITSFVSLLKGRLLNPGKTQTFWRGEHLTL